jgi:hypothetical protein
MKIGLSFVILCLFLPIYAHAEEETPDRAAILKDMTDITFCMANESILMQHRLQVGITLTAQTDKNSQLTALAESFATMAKTNHDQIEMYSKIVKEDILPEITRFVDAKEEDVLNLTNSALETITAYYNAQPLDKQVIMERKIIEKAKSCESLAMAIQKRHTM